MTTTDALSGSDQRTRKLRSRVRLLDAAVALLESGGAEAVTVDGVTRRSGISRATLYRHFDNATQLRSAALARLLPPVAEAPSPDGPLRERLIELVDRQAATVDSTPLHLMALASITLSIHSERGPDSTALCDRLVDQYCRPFDRLLDSADARAVLGTCDTTTLVTRLIGPIVFGRLIGLRRTGHTECADLVDDFLAAHAAAGDG